MMESTTEKTIRTKYESLRTFMSELMRRRWAATEALTLGRGGISVVARATKLSRNTIARGIAELSEINGSISELSTQTVVRRAGGGRKEIIDHDPELLTDLQSLVDHDSRGDPESPLQWTCKSTRKLAQELKVRGHKVGTRTVANLLKQINFSLQGNRKTKEGSTHPDRNAQFEYINSQVLSFQKKGQPVISVDAKKKELIGNFLNKGREWRPKKSPKKVNVYDFMDKELGKGIPYGVYDMTLNEGWVSVGVDHDTARFAASTILHWWRRMGAIKYPSARELLITADGGGSNSRRSRLWKIALQELADTIGISISVCHFPPGTSKWNKIEHRMFSYITENWRGRPLRSLEIVVNLIGNTTTTTGLHIDAEIDRDQYEIGIKVSDEELAAVKIQAASFHGEWNYTILPRR